MSNKHKDLDNFISTAFSERLKAALDASNMRVDELASQTELSRSILYKYLNRPDDANPSITNVARIAKVLGIANEDLMPQLPNDEPMSDGDAQTRPRASRLPPPLAEAKRALLAHSKDIARIIEMPVLTATVAGLDVDRLTAPLLMLSGPKAGSRGIYSVVQVPNAEPDPESWITRWEIEPMMGGLPRLYWNVRITRAIDPPDSPRPGVTVTYELEDPGSLDKTHPMLLLNSGLWQFVPNHDETYTVTYSSIVGLSKREIGQIRLIVARIVLPMLTRVVFGRYCDALKQLQRELEIDDLITDISKRIRGRRDRQVGMNPSTTSPSRRK